MSSDVQGEPVGFLKSSNFLRSWKACEGHRCALHDVRLFNDAKPPLLAFPPQRAIAGRAVNEVPKRKNNEQADDDPWLNLLEAGAKAAGAAAPFSDWLEQPAPLPKPKVQPPAPPVKRVPPFDIQDVPKAMRKLEMPVSAKLQERWFAGYPNYSRSAKDLQNEIDQNALTT
jgi:hypothetical protein